MNRRGFFAALASVAIVAATPIPTLRAYVERRTRNLLLTPDMITREALRVLSKTCVLTTQPDRRYDPAFLRGTHGTEIVRVRLPKRMRA